MRLQSMIFRKFNSLLLRSGAFLLKRLLAPFGYAVVRQGLLNDIRSSRRSAVRRLIETNIVSFPRKPGATGIVFSKDRALQLHALLNSYRLKCMNPPKLIIIYTASSPAHMRAYEELIKIYDHVDFNYTFVAESGPFKNVLLSTLKAIHTSNLFFIVDDNVCINSFDGLDLERVDSRKFILSLRMSPNCVYSYTGNSYHTPPPFTVDAEQPQWLHFEWGVSANEWSYPYSLDGHVFPTSEIHTLAELGEYNGPNSFEVLLMSFNDIGMSKGGICYSNSRVLNLPINKVQVENDNLHGTVSAENLLDCWMAGKVLDFSTLDGHEPVSPHEEHYLSLVDRF